MRYEIVAEEGLRNEIAGWVDADVATAPATVIPDQTHGTRIALIGRDGLIHDLKETDGIICLTNGIRIGVRTADCVPLVVYAPDIRAIGAFHAGWKGSLGGIVSRGIEMLTDMGADPGHIRCWFGPSICGECYEVSEELAEKFREEGFGANIISHRHIDLEGVNRSRLTAAGVLPGHIAGKRHCTFSTPALPSWRRDCGTTRRLLTSIELKG